MRLKNKKTGEIVDLSEGFITDAYGGEKIKIKPVAISNEEGYVYSSLAELIEEWEDYHEEPKKYWYIDIDGEITCGVTENGIDKDMQAIDNYFETKEEAEKAVRKLKAWKRLKDNGFRLDAVVDTFFCLDVFMQGEPYEAIKDDLKIVFGGEE